MWCIVKETEAESFLKSKLGVEQEPSLIVCLSRIQVQYLADFRSVGRKQQRMSTGASGEQRPTLKNCA
jgi:hypothetical protein